ncbi:glycine zipper 2TM domain-containing protein [Psychromonas sp. MME2]|uniref:glycine zipper 2TM domain-containing protein n=1 Tax=Psychromonas sp. MME2 TaxID=3231033 RepID=UPI00339C8378
MKNLPLSLSMIFIALSFGCAPNPYGDTYAVGDAQKVQNVSYGVIKKVEPVNIEGEGSTVGTLAGAVVGGLIGSTIGGGTGSSIAAVGGAVAGGVAGNEATQAITKRNGVNITITLDSGNTIAVVQEADPNMIFQVGQRVQINSQGNKTRVVPE